MEIVVATTHLCLLASRLSVTSFGEMVHLLSARGFLPPVRQQEPARAVQRAELTEHHSLLICHTALPMPTGFFIIFQYDFFFFFNF